MLEAGGTDANFNGQADIEGVDTDADGLVNSVDPNNGGTSLPLTDSDNDGIPDYLESNQTDTDQNLTLNHLDNNDNGDTLNTRVFND